jgi:hypothetical protein
MAAFVTKLKFHPIARALSKSRAFKNEARKVANAKFQRAKNSLINNFNSHPVTREIEAGPEADNSSRTLGGSGNLFTFIGFFREDNPVEMVRNALQRHIKITSGKFTSRKDSVSAEFTISAPTTEDLASVAPMPWEGKSWVKAIESGMSGFGYYMYKRSEASRSGHGLQIDKKVRNGGFKPVKYYSALFRKFRKEIVMS